MPHINEVLRWTISFEILIIDKFNLHIFNLHTPVVIKKVVKIFWNGTSDLIHILFLQTCCSIYLTLVSGLALP